MKNQNRWKPTKVVRGPDGFRPSSDPKFLSVSSRLVAARQVQHYHAIIQKFASGHLLDLGCGFVPYYELYKNLIDDVTCVDWENSLHQNEFVDHFLDLNQPLALASQSFDTVLLTDVLEHIYQPTQLLSEVFRLLRPGGHLLLGVPFFYWLHERPFDFHRYTEFALRRMCEGLGMEIKSLSPYGGAPEILADIVGKCLASSKLSSICSIYTATCSAILKWKPAKVLSERTATTFPLGYVLVARKGKENG